MVKEEKNESVYANIEAFYNHLLTGDEDIPEEIVWSILICLNQVLGENGKLETIRPRAVNGHY